MLRYAHLPYSSLKLLPGPKPQCEYNLEIKTTRIRLPPQSFTDLYEPVEKSQESSNRTYRI